MNAGGAQRAGQVLWGALPRSDTSHERAFEGLSSAPGKRGKRSYIERGCPRPLRLWFTFCDLDLHWT